MFLWFGLSFRDRMQECKTLVKELLTNTEKQHIRQARTQMRYKLVIKLVFRDFYIQILSDFLYFCEAIYM